MIRELLVFCLFCLIFAHEIQIENLQNDEDRPNSIYFKICLYKMHLGTIFWLENFNPQIFSLHSCLIKKDKTISQILINKQIVLGKTWTINHAKREYLYFKTIKHIFFIIYQNLPKPEYKAHGSSSPLNDYDIGPSTSYFRHARTCPILGSQLKGQ